MTGPVKTSPSGKFSCPSQLIHVCPATEMRHVRAVGGDDVIIALPVEEIDQSLLPLADLLPRRDRVGPIEQAGVEDEIFVLREAHLRVLCRGLRGEIASRTI
jgi:hypothetical protein